MYDTCEGSEDNYFFVALLHYFAQGLHARRGIDVVDLAVGAVDRPAGNLQQLEAQHSLVLGGDRALRGHDLEIALHGLVGGGLCWRQFDVARLHGAGRQIHAIADGEAHGRLQQLVSLGVGARLRDPLVHRDLHHDAIVVGLPAFSKTVVDQLGHAVGVGRTVGRRRARHHPEIVSCCKEFASNAMTFCSSVAVS